MTYWEAAYILEQGSLDYGKTQEAIAIATEVLKERIKKLDEAEDAKIRELPKRGPLYGTKPGALIIDEFLGKNEVHLSKDEKKGVTK